MMADDRGPRTHRIGYRPTKAEREQRLSQIHSLLISGASRRHICQFVSEKTTWSLTPRSISRLISAATKLIQVSAAFERDTELGLAITQVKDLYSKSMRIQDYKACLAARRELNELLGLYSPRKVELGGEGGGPMRFIALIPGIQTDKDLWSQQCKQELAEREQRLQEQQAGPGRADS